MQGRSFSRFFLLALAMPVSTSLFAQSTVAPATDSTIVVRYAHAAEADPLTETAKQERKEAMTFAENDHNAHVLLCSQLFHQMTSSHAANAGEINLQYVVSSAAFLYEHPEAASDSLSQNIAGIDAALNVYEKFLAADSKSRSKSLDSLLKQRNDGKLKDVISQTCK